jgi:hypothetical protein
MMESVITEGSGVRGLGFPFHHLTTKQKKRVSGLRNRKDMQGGLRYAAQVQKGGLNCA